MKIPETSNPFKVIVNGVEKTYEAGATVSDDASVKEIIDNGDSFPPEALPVDTPFPIPTPEPGTTVVANPTLAGTEDSLTGLQVGDTKYSVGGSGGGVLVATVDSATGALDKTWQEIHDADYAVMKSIESSAIAAAPLVNVYSLGEEKYVANFFNGEGILSFETTSADGYPTYAET